MTMAVTPRRNSISSFVNENGVSLNNASYNVGIQSLNSVSRISSLNNPSISSFGEGFVEAAEVSSRATLEEIENDEVFSKFLSNDFNPTTFASQVLGSGSASDFVKKLSEGIQILDRQLRNEVVLRHGELLQQLTSLKDTENVLSVVRAGSDSLIASIQRVRSEVADPYKQLNLKTRQLSALHATIELLRTVVKILKQSKKLKDHMSQGGDKVDLAKAAQLYSELETMRKEADVDSISAIHSEMRWMVEIGQRIRNDAMKMLEEALQSLNQAEVGSVLQVYFNIGELKNTVDAMVAKFKVQGTKCISQALDMKAISSASNLSSVPGGVSRIGTPQMGTSSRVKDATWQRLIVCMDSLHGIMIGCWHLQRVLAKKRDPITHIVFMDEVMQPGESFPTEKVWDSISRAISMQFRACFTASTFIKETFVSSYPKLLSLVQNLLDKIQKDTDVRGVPPGIRSEHRQQFLSALEPFQGAFLAQSFVRLTDFVNHLLPAGSRGSLPSPDQVNRFVSKIEEEVDAVKQDQALTFLVVKGIVKSLQLFAERSEYQVATGPDSCNVSGPATSAEQRNISLCLLLQELHRKLSITAVEFADDAQEIMIVGLNAISSIAYDAISPLFKAMVDKIESIILKMHDHEYGDEKSMDEDEGRGCSSYMEEILKSLSHFRVEFLSRLLPSSSSSFSLNSSSPSPSPSSTNNVDSICIDLTKRMAARIIVFFLRHASLIRQLSELGKLQLAKDMGELEFSIGQNVCPLQWLGQTYKSLHAFRPLLFLETSQLENNPILLDFLPSVVLHHLYSRGSLLLESPITRNGLTPAKYSLWLDRHTEEDAWKEVRSSLEAYANEAQSKGSKEFDPVYLLMLRLGPTLLQNFKLQNLA